jgi:hypothetical protein
MPKVKAVKRPKVKISGEDGNAFFIIGKCTRALKEAGQADKVDAFMKEAMGGDYDNVLRTAMKYCDVS